MRAPNFSVVFLGVVHEIFAVLPPRRQTLALIKRDNSTPSQFICDTQGVWMLSPSLKTVLKTRAPGVPDGHELVRLHFPLLCWRKRLADRRIRSYCSRVIGLIPPVWIVFPQGVFAISRSRLHTVRNKNASKSELFSTSGTCTQMLRDQVRQDGSGRQWRLPSTIRSPVSQFSVPIRVAQFPVYFEFRQSSAFRIGLQFRCVNEFFSSLCFN